MRAHWFVRAVAALVGVGMLGAGVWCLVSPASFARAVAFPNHEHFLHDLGAFQLGAGATLLLALLWRDALATALAGFLVGNSIHAWNHFRDLDLGGHLTDPWGLTLASLLLAGAVWLRLRQLGYVVGDVAPATTPALEPFAQQKTVVVTTYRRDGTPVPTPVSLAVDGDRGLMRSFATAGKTRRLRRNPLVRIAPSTGRGMVTGPAIEARARLLDGSEARYAARALSRRHPLLHGVVVPLTHRLFRARYGRTVHFELVPLDRVREGTPPKPS